MFVMDESQSSRWVVALMAAALCSGLFFGPAWAAPGSWSSTGPFGSVRSKIAVDPSNPDVIYATASLSGLFKTVDAGVTWVQSDTGLPPGAIDVEVDPNNPLRVYAIAADAVFRSNDGGLNWFASGSGTSGRVFDITVSTTLPTTLYAAGTDGVFRSTTFGSSWAPVNTGLPTPIQSTFPVVVDPSDGDHVLLSQISASGDAEVYETTTGGSSWALVTGSWAPTDFVRDIAFGPGPTTYVAAGVALHSKLGLGAWTAGANLAQFEAIDPHPTDVGRVLGLVGFGSGVHETLNSGASWVELGASITPNGFDVASANDGAYRPGMPTTVYVMATGAGFQHSVDSGMTWSARSNGLRANNIRAVAVHPNDPDYIYAGASNGQDALGGVYRSTDNGVTWSQSNSGLDLLGVRDIAIDPNTAAATATTHLYAMGYGRNSLDAVTPHEVGLFKSTDGGASWFPSRNGIPDSASVRLSSPLRRLVMDPTSGSSGGTGPLQTLYVAGSGSPLRGSSRIYKSTDAGANWSASEGGMPTLLSTELQIAIDLVIDPANPNNLYVGMLLSDFGPTPTTTPNGIFKSIDGGATWSHSSVGLPLKVPTIPGSAQHDILALAIDPTTPSTLYAGVVNFDSTGTLVARIYKSVDSAATWALSSTGIAPGSDIRAIEVDPANPATVYAALAQSGGSPGGVYRSDDFGVTWSSISVGLPVSSATSLAIDNSGLNSVLYAGTGGGVYEIEQLPDLDLDGASTDEEAAAPNAGDGNNDGTADANQTSVASIALPAIGLANAKGVLALQGTTPQPYLTIAIVGGSCDSIVNAQILNGEDYPQEPAYSLPVGMLSFELPDCGSATVELIFNQVDMSLTDRVRNFGPTTPGDGATLTSYDFAGASRSSNTWTLVLADGELGDVRPADGTILFRGGPAAFINELFADGFE